MHTFKRCLSVFIAVTMTFTMLMTLGIAKDSAGYSLEANEPEVVTAYTDAEPGAIIVDNGKNNADAKTDGEATTVFSAPPDENANVYDNSISGTLWIDMFEDIGNGIYGGDGIRQPSEGALAGYDVSLYAADKLSDILRTVQTDSRGKYIFTGLEPGSYAVGISSGTLGDVEYLLSFAGVSGDNRFHAPDETTDYKTAFSGTVNVDEGTHTAGIDAGMRTPPMIRPMAAGDFVVTRDVDGAIINGTCNTLDAAITAIPADNANYTITVTTGVTVNMTSALTIGAKKNVTIKSASAASPSTIYQPWAVRHFTVTGAIGVTSSLTLEDIILDGNSAHGGVEVDTNGSLTMNSGAVIQNCVATSHKGGGVYITGSNSRLYMNDGAKIQSCVGSGGGGGVYLESGGAFTMNGGIISGNTAADSGTGNGGGVYAYNGCTFTMNGGEISGNTASASTDNTYAGGGGGVSLSIANFKMTGGKISGNTATKGTLEGWGGGVCMYMANFSMSGGEISGNKTSSNGCTYGWGGGVLVSGGDTFTMSGNAVIKDNTADQYGGGVHVVGQFTMSGGTISGNTASTTGNGYGGGVSVVPGLSTDSPTFKMTGGTISGNFASTAADGYGGGVYLMESGSSLTMTPTSKDSCEISGNTASTSGGGVYITSSGTFTMNGGAVCGNTASAGNGGGVYITSNGYFTVADSSIADMNYDIINNSALSGNGGGIYTADASYTNLKLSAKTNFYNNTAKDSYDNTVPTLPNIQFAHTSLNPSSGNPFSNPLNNYDIGTPVKSISVQTQPNLVYASGDKLDLSALVITVEYNDGTPTANIPYASLTGAGYSINGPSVISGQTFMTKTAHNGNTVTISYGGQTAVTSQLTVYELPTVNTSVNNITSNSATINYTVTTTGNYTTKLQVFNGSVWSDVSGTTSPYPATGLAPNTSYQYRVYVSINGTGLAYVFPISFKTLAQNSSGVNVSGTVDNAGASKPMVVTIKLGNTVIASAIVTEISNGTYRYAFTNIPNGFFDLVSNNGSYYVTKAIHVKGNHITGFNIDMTADKKESELQIVGKDLPIAVNGLQDLQNNSNLYTNEDQILAAANGTVDFKLVVEEKYDSNIPSDAAEIKSFAPEKTIGLYLDFSVVKNRILTNGELESTTLLPDLGNNFITIYYYLPDYLTGKGNLTVYRVHNGTPEQLSSRKDPNNEYAVFYNDDGGYMAEIHVNKFSTYAIAYNNTNTNTNTYYSRSSGGGKSSSAVKDVSTYWIEVPEAKTMAKSALNEKLDYARSRRDTITGIRKNSLLVLAESGLRYRHDTVSDGAVQVRVYIDNPSKAAKDILVSGYVNGDSVDNIKAKFEKKFQNKLAVIGLDQQGGFGIKVQIAAKVNLSGMNTKNLYFYSYNKSTGKYIRIETEYRIDENGYLHFSTMQGGYIIISDGPFTKHGAEQNSGTQLHNPETGGDSPSETRVAANSSSLTYGNDNPETVGDSPEEIWITGNSSPQTIENFTSDGGDKPEIMLSASTSEDESNVLKRGSYINIKTAAVSFAVLFAVILVGVCISRLRNFRRYNGR